MIKVLHIVETIGSGGVERRKLLICKNLNSNNFEHKVICTQAYGVYKNEFSKYNVEVIEIGKLSSPFEIKKQKAVQEVIRKFKPDIIHGAVFEGVTLAAISGWLCRVPKIIIEETSDPKTRSWKANLLMRVFCFLSDRIVAVSPASYNYLCDTLKVSKKKCRLINNGVADPRYLNSVQKSTLKSELAIQDEEIVLGGVGRMHDDTVKRFSDLIRVTAVLNNEGYRVKLLLVGGGREQAHYKVMAEKLQIADKVIFTDYQNDVQPYYEIMDIFMLLSSTESFGLVLAEAMYHRLPIVATQVGGIPYIVEDQVQGLLIREYNIANIAEQVRHLINNPEQRKKMGISGYEKAKDHYSETVYTTKISQLYFD